METLEERISKEEVNELDRLAYFPGGNTPRRNSPRGGIYL